MTRIFLSKFGFVDDSLTEWILGVLEDCYRRIGRPELLELWIFERASRMDAVLAGEAAFVGVRGPVSGLGFFATHDAWRGTPRIMVCLERMRGLPRLLQLGGLRHEAGHSVLHGSLEHYIFPMPRSLLKASELLGGSRELAETLLYLLSIAVKDYEVERLLVDHGFINCQFAYAEYVIKPSREEVEAWRRLSTPGERALYIAQLLKGVGCLAPILEVKSEAENLLEDSLRHLPGRLREGVREAMSFLSAPKGDTLTRLRILSNFFHSRIVAQIIDDREETLKSNRKPSKSPSSGI